MSTMQFSSITLHQDGWSAARWLEISKPLHHRSLRLDHSLDLLAGEMMAPIPSLARSEESVGDAGTFDEAAFFFLAPKLGKR